MAKAFLKLTRSAIRRLSLRGCITEHGITFERNANGDGVYTVNVMVNGQRIHRVIGRESDGTTRTQAEEFIEKVRQDAKHDRLALPRGRKIAMSFKQAADKYLVMLDQGGGKNIPKKRRQLELHLVPFFGDLPLSKISSFDVERYKKCRTEERAIKSHGCSKGTTYKGEGTAPGTVNRELAVLSQLFNKAIEWEWMDRRPAKINRYREDGGRIKYLTVDQVKDLIECAKADQNPQIYPFVVIGVETSMRCAEILSIRREHIDLDRHVIYIPKAKAGAREQPITKHLAEFLRGYMAGLQAGTLWLFPSPAARAGHTTDVRKPFRRVVAAAGMNPDEVVRHTLRHTAITHLVQSGVDLPTIKRISGHKTLIMVERYAHANGEHIRSAMDKLEQRLKIS